jgi:hypothetical protein
LLDIRLRSFRRGQGQRISNHQLGEIARIPRRCLVTGYFENEFDFKLDGPLEPVKPKFVRAPYEESASMPIEMPAIGAGKAGKKKSRRAVSPSQAFIGAFIAEVCALGLGWATLNAFIYLSENPPLSTKSQNFFTTEVNLILVSFLVGSGGLIVGMFAFTGIGLIMLGYQKQQALKATPWQDEKLP